MEFLPLIFDGKISRIITFNNTCVIKNYLNSVKGIITIIFINLISKTDIIFHSILHQETMTNFIDREIDAMVDMVEAAKRQGIDECCIPIITRPFYEDANEVAPAAKYMKKDTEEYYYLASDQYTVRPCSEGTDLMDILSPDGIKLYQTTQQRYERGEWKDSFDQYGLEMANSGFWSADKESQYYLSDKPHTYLNSWNNVNVVGYSEKIGAWITTSPAIFVTENWCLTKSGSLYKLNGEKLSIGTIMELQANQQRR